MDGLHLIAEPWWVNLLVLVPVVSFFLWRRKGLTLSWHQLLWLLLFGVAFGFVESAVVVYLRSGLALPDPPASSQLQHYEDFYQRAMSSLSLLPKKLITIEIAREACTMVMLVMVALLTGVRARERWAAFLWAFAAWDLTYYAGLWATLRWPSSLKDFDVLFLIPVPWVAQVWFPVLVSGLALVAVAITEKKQRSDEPAINPPLSQAQTLQDGPPV